MHSHIKDHITGCWNQSQAFESWNRIRYEKKKKSCSTFIPIKTKPREILQDGLLRFLSRPLQISVFNSQNKLAPIGPEPTTQTLKPQTHSGPKQNKEEDEPGKEIIEEGSSSSTNVQIPSRRRSKANTYLVLGRSRD